MAFGWRFGFARGKGINWQEPQDGYPNLLVDWNAAGWIEMPENQVARQ